VKIALRLLAMTLVIPPAYATFLANYRNDLDCDILLRRNRPQCERAECVTSPRRAWPRIATVEDLKDLGVFIVGHRRKLLEAIAALRTWENRSRSAHDAAGYYAGGCGNGRNRW
jgi:hypothetical protein